MNPSLEQCVLAGIRDFIGRFRLTPYHFVYEADCQSMLYCGIYGHLASAGHLQQVWNVCSWPGPSGQVPTSILHCQPTPEDSKPDIASA